MKNNYYVDTNVLIDYPESVEVLRNGVENNVYIALHSMYELDKLKRDERLRGLVRQSTDYLARNKHLFKVATLLNEPSIAGNLKDKSDLYILHTMMQNVTDIPDPILVSNDKIFRLIAETAFGIQCQPYKTSRPNIALAEKITGISKDNSKVIIPNSFYFQDGKPVFKSFDGTEKVIGYQNDAWKVSPRNLYQNLAFELMLNPDIHITTLQSDAGYGKSFLSLAAAFYLVLEKKQYNKIYVVKPMKELGEPMGFLPGKIEEKMAPYVSYISDLVLKLHEYRNLNKIIANPDAFPVQFNSKKFNILPLQFIRGMNIENSVVIIDEVQNISRNICRALLSRMGQNVKCFCLGDIRQVDDPYLSYTNNGMNWIVKHFMGKKIYAHMVLKGEKSRGPITDLVIQSGLYQVFRHR